MAQCTAPINGHRTASGRANCPVCGRGFSSYSARFQPHYYSAYNSSTISSSSRSTKSIADKELSALLARDLLVPVVHHTTFEDLREVSPLLGSRSGLSTTEESMENVAAKIAELTKLS